MLQPNLSAVAERRTGFAFGLDRSPTSVLLRKHPRVGATHVKTVEVPEHLIVRTDRIDGYTQATGYGGEVSALENFNGLSRENRVQSVMTTKIREQLLGHLHCPRF